MEWVLGKKGEFFLLYLKNKLYLCSRKVDRFVMIATTEK